ncbi:MAG: hypothetical protein DRG78_12745 [Epsilonproteobacteria bacterium]|nr:MAG: hypothetical protein DRG78_12745 [Campylobacterota bacterium]
MKRMILLIFLCISVFANSLHNYKITYKDEVPNNYKDVIEYISNKVHGRLFEDKSIVSRDASVKYSYDTKSSVEVFLSFDTKNSSHNAFEIKIEFERLDDKTLTVGKIARVMINGMSDEKFSTFIGKKYTKDGEYLGDLPSEKEVEEDSDFFFNLFIFVAFVIFLLYSRGTGKSSSSSNKKNAVSKKNKKITTVIFNNGRAMIKYKNGTMTGSFSIQCDEVVNWAEQSVTCKKYSGTGKGYRIWTIDTDNQTIEATTVNK